MFEMFEIFAKIGSKLFGSKDHDREIRKIPKNHHPLQCFDRYGPCQSCQAKRDMKIIGKNFGRPPLDYDLVLVE
jgi:hypothetical protein